MSETSVTGRTPSTPPMQQLPMSGDALRSLRSLPRDDALAVLLARDVISRELRMLSKEPES